MANGNVGEHLSDYASSSTFLTTDGGISWSEVRSGPHRFEIGDRGAILMTVNDKDATTHVRYATHF